MRRNFTLVELMIVVAIIAVLAAVAIPHFADMQSRARLAEAPPNVDALHHAAEGAAAAGVAVIAMVGHPRALTSLDKTAVSWTTPTPPVGFATAGWAPDGLVRCEYELGLSNGGWGVVDIMVNAYCDVDNDNVVHYFVRRWNDGRVVDNYDKCVWDTGAGATVTTCY